MSNIGIYSDKETIFNSRTAKEILNQRYLKTDDKGAVIETPEKLFKRVATSIAQADVESPELAKRFYNLMMAGVFLPSSPILMNAGTETPMLSACFTLPIEDTLDNIFETIKNAAKIFKMGGGVGYSFSKLRPKNDVVHGTGGVSSGPVSFMRVFNAATEAIKQGGRRKGANLGVLRVDHPDIEEFIDCKRDPKEFTNFNLSVGITDKFMRAFYEGKSFNLINPRTKEVTKTVSAKYLFYKIIDSSWETGDPGILFLDAMNRHNPTPSLGEIECTNPCGEAILMSSEACNLGSINVSKFVDKHNKLNLASLGEAVKTAVKFLDSVVDINKYPLPEITEVVRGNRKIGLGIMGFADMLIKMGIPYSSPNAIDTAKCLISFIKEVARDTSSLLAESKGVFPNHKYSIFSDNGYKPRNASLLSIAPTGTISILAGCSSGIEPIFAIAYTRTILDGTKFQEVHPLFEEVAHREGFYSEDLIKKIANNGASVQNILEIPKKYRDLFLVASDILPEQHVEIQAAFQEHVDHAISKTCNLPASATKQDIANIYKLAHKKGLKGITIYRDGSREGQVLTVSQSESCPECVKIIYVGKDGHELKGDGFISTVKCPECEELLKKFDNGYYCEECEYYKLT